LSQAKIKRNIILFQIVILMSFSIFVVRIWWLQNMGENSATYQILANVNRFQDVAIDAPRGVMYDRNGTLLVRNRPMFDVVIVPAFLPDDETEKAQIYATLSGWLQLPITTAGERELPSRNGYFRSFMHHEYSRQPSMQVRNPRSRQVKNRPLGIKDSVEAGPAFAPYKPIVIAEDVEPKVVALIEENRLDLPGVLIEIGSQREYLMGELTSHVIGYVGAISPELEDSFPAPFYDPNEDVGIMGLEATYETYLHGQRGFEKIEVDVTGRKMRTINKEQESIPGNNLRLTLDLRLQEIATEALQNAIDVSKGQSGVAIAMDPRTGEILSLVSLPSYDNNLFATGISEREFLSLAENEQRPLLNKAISGQYPPGSTYKHLVVAGALEEGVITSEKVLFDPGVIYLPNRFVPYDLELAQPFFCWDRGGHGWVNAVRALTVSCDVYLYKIGGGWEQEDVEGLGVTRIGNYAARFGFGAVTGVDILGEEKGIVPTEQWKRHNFAEAWFIGDTYNMSIGQGFVLVTPLQLLNSYAAVANGGTFYQPYFVSEVRNLQQEIIYTAKPIVSGQLGISQETLDLVRQGLRGVVNLGGTAYPQIDLAGITSAGKTGTAEFCDEYPACLDEDGRVKTSHAWYVGYAPFDRPEIVSMAFVYGGGEGSAISAPVVNAIFRYYFGLDQDTAEAEHLLTTVAPDTLFKSRMVGSNIIHSPYASVSGIVFNHQKKGVPNVTIQLIADGRPFIHVKTNSVGQFHYETIDPNFAQNWQIELGNYPVENPIRLTVGTGIQYLLEFEAKSGSQ